MVAPPTIAIEGVHWASLLIGLMGVIHPIQPNTTWYDICGHTTNVVMEPNKHGCQSIWEEGSKVQDHTAMSA